MGRTNRSRKRRDKMNLLKKERYDARELIRLKKTLGLIDAEGNEVMKEVADIATVRTGEELKSEQQKKKSKEELELEYELEEKVEKGEEVPVVYEKTGKTRVYNSKTLKDQNGCYPPWFNFRKTAKRLRKKAYARKRKFKQAWTVVNVPL